MRRSVLTTVLCMYSNYERIQYAACVYGYQTVLRVSPTSCEMMEDHSQADLLAKSISLGVVLVVDPSEARGLIFGVGPS